MHQQVQTTLVKYEQKSGTSARGSWTRHSFTAADNTKFQTFDNALANLAMGYLNQPVALTFEVEQRGQYTNNNIVAIGPAGGAVAQQAVTPAAVPAVVQAPAFETDEIKALRIARIAALQRVGELKAAGVVQVEGAVQAMELATIFTRFILNGFQSSGSGAPAAAASSSGVGAETAGVAQAAPATPVAAVGQPAPAPVAAAAPVAQTTLPNDGIPY